MKRLLNLALLFSFLLTILVPFTGVTLHKLASILFLLLTAVHTVIYRKKFTSKRWLLFFLIMLCFVTGIIGMIFDGIIPLLALHKVLSMAVLFFLAIHLFLHRHKMT